RHDAGLDQRARRVRDLADALGGEFDRGAQLAAAGADAGGRADRVRGIVVPENNRIGVERRQVDPFLLDDLAGPVDFTRRRHNDDLPRADAFGGGGEVFADHVSVAAPALINASASQAKTLIDVPLNTVLG